MEIDGLRIGFAVSQFINELMQHIVDSLGCIFPLQVSYFRFGFLTWRTILKVLFVCPKSVT